MFNFVVVRLVIVAATVAIPTPGKLLRRGRHFELLGLMLALRVAPRVFLVRRFPKKAAAAPELELGHAREQSRIRPLGGGRCRACSWWFY